jgi:hypothetical protein
MSEDVLSAFVLSLRSVGTSDHSLNQITMNGELI